VPTSAQALVDATVPLAAAVGGKATRTVGVWQGSMAQQAQELVPDGVHVISALHTVSAASLTDLSHTLDEDVLVCGQRRADKRRVAEIIDRVEGLRCVDAGRLRPRGSSGRSQRCSSASKAATGLTPASGLPAFRAATCSRR
jgi:NADPH-dependent F420 reductase